MVTYTIHYVVPGDIFCRTFIDALSNVTTNRTPSLLVGLTGSSREESSHMPSIVALTMEAEYKNLHDHRSAQFVPYNAHLLRVPHVKARIPRY